MHALHNANIAHKIFTEDLYSLPPVTIDRSRLHKILASKLRNESLDDEEDQILYQQEHEPSQAQQMEILGGLDVSMAQSIALTEEMHTIEQ